MDDRSPLPAGVTGGIAHTPVDPSDTQKVASMVKYILKLDAEVQNLKEINLALSARMLRLELAVSALDKDGTLDAILRPDKQPEQF